MDDFDHVMLVPGVERRHTAGQCCICVGNPGRWSIDVAVGATVTVAVRTGVVAAVVTGSVIISPLRGARSTVLGTSM